MAQEKNFKVCTSYYLESDDGEVVNLPDEYVKVEQIDDFPYYKFAKYESDDSSELCWGLIDAHGEEIVPARYEAIYNCESSPYAKDSYLILRKGEQRKLWAINQRCHLLGFKSFMGIATELICGNLIPVSDNAHSMECARHYGSWRLVHIQSGEVISRSYYNIKFGNDRYLIVCKSQYDDSRGLFDTMRCQQTFPCRASWFGFSQDFILVNYEKSSKIITQSGYAIISRLSEYAEIVDSLPEPNLFLDPPHNGFYTKYYRVIKMCTFIAVIVITTTIHKRMVEPPEFLFFDSYGVRLGTDEFKPFPDYVSEEAQDIAKGLINKYFESSLVY